MHPAQLPYRQLYDALLAYAGDAAHDDLLRPWLAANDGERRWLAGIRARRGSPVPPMPLEERWRLYALSRILQLLQLSFAPAGDAAAWKVPAIGRGEYDAFVAGLGLEAVGPMDFHPVHHEIVAVDEAPEKDAAPRVVRTYWPGCMLGPLLVVRAGVGVMAGRAHVSKEIAERSTLYWAYARNHRPAADPGHGWGGNSQWRTSFRRDYLLDGAVHYNVDGHTPPRADEDLDAAEWSELLRHRCFVACAKPDGDRWPYDLVLAENA